MPAATTLFAKETNFQLCSYRQSSSRHSQAATHDTHTRRTRHIVSIPAAFAGCGVSTSGSNETMVPFQSPQPSGAATRSWTSRSQARTYFNPRSPRGLRPVRADVPGPGRQISITAALGGCDRRRLHVRAGAGISIPAALGGCDDIPDGQSVEVRPFQSPQPSGAATATYCSIANLATISLRHYARVSRVNDSFCWQLDYTGANPTRKRWLPYGRMRTLISERKEAFCII